jgi:hypothetical protein
MAAGSRSGEFTKVNTDSIFCPTVRAAFVCCDDEV